MVKVMNQQYPKLYILIKDSIDLGHAVVAAAHAPLVYLKTIDELGIKVAFQPEGGKEYDDLSSKWGKWLEDSFRKVVCKVTEEEFEKAKESEVYHVVLTESGLDNQEVAIVFGPQYEWPKFFQYLKLYK